MSHCYFTPPLWNRIRIAPEATIATPAAGLTPERIAELRRRNAKRQGLTPYANDCGCAAGCSRCNLVGTPTACENLRAAIADAEREGA